MVMQYSDGGYSYVGTVKIATNSQEVTMIRPAKREETAAVIALCKATGLFQTQELDALSAMLAEYFQGTLGEDHCWLVDDDNGLIGVAYYAPETFANGV